jgi:hypothetical protein
VSFQFTKFEVFPYIAANRYALEWDGIGLGSFTFVIEYGPNETGPWQKLQEVTDAKSIIVSVAERNLSLTDRTWFRLAAKQNNQIAAYSSPTGVGVDIDREDYLRYREMLRRWNLELRKYIGSRGKLLRLRYFGEVASNVHPILGQPIGTEDVDGLGQKYKGGYWPAIEMYAAYTDTTEETQQSKVEEQGLSETDVSAFYAMPFPILKPKDVWVNTKSNTRHIVDRVQTVDFIGYRVKQLVQISRLPVTDPAYKVPL